MLDETKYSEPFSMTIQLDLENPTKEIITMWQPPYNSVSTQYHLKSQHMNP